MKEKLGRVCWRRKDGSDAGHHGSQPMACAERDRAILSSPHMRMSDVDYWVEPVGEPKPPETKKAETLWQIHYRRPDGRLGMCDCGLKDTYSRRLEILKWVTGFAGNDWTYWLQPADSDPALKDGETDIRWRVHYRDREAGYRNNRTQTYATAKEASDFLARAPQDPSKDYWVQPEPAPVEAKKPELKWTTHYRKPNGDKWIGRTGLSLEDAKADVAMWNKEFTGDINWIQPAGTEPALKAGAGKIKWRVHWMLKTSGKSGTLNWSHDSLEAAKSYIGSDPAAGDYYHWAQPEAVEQPKQEAVCFPTIKIVSPYSFAYHWANFKLDPRDFQANDLRATFGLPLIPAKPKEKPKPYERRWKYAGNAPFCVQGSPYGVTFVYVSRAVHVAAGNSAEAPEREMRRLLAMEPENADKELDSLYAAQSRLPP